MSEAISEPPVEPEAGNTTGAGDAAPPHKPRRRGSRGGRNRKRPPAAAASAAAADVSDRQPDLPDRISENRPSVEAAERALIRKPQIGDSRPAPARPPDLPPGP